MLGIHSPSKVFRDEVGVFMAKGLGVGFEEGMSDVEKDMVKSIPTSFDVAPTISHNARTSMNSPLSGTVIHHVTTLDGKVIAEETFPVIDKMMGRKMSLVKGGIL